MNKIKIFNLQCSVLFPVYPDYLPGISRILFINRVTFDNKTLLTVIHFITDPFVGVFLHFLAGNVLIGELAAHEGARLVAGTDPFDPF